MADTTNSSILKIKLDATGEWIDIPALKGKDGKTAYEYAVEAGYTGTEAELSAALAKADDYATKTELTAEETARIEGDKALQDAIDALKEEVGDDLTEKLDEINEDIEAIEDELAKKANSEDVYTKTETDAKLSSVYKYRGSIADYASLPTDNLIAGDVYNVEDTGDNYAWTGTEWDKLAGTIDLTDYALTADVTTAIAAEATARANADTALQTNITAEETARIAGDAALQTKITEEETARIAADAALQTNITAEETARIAADKVLQDAIDQLETDAITVHNDLTGRSEEDCHPISAITGLQTNLTSIETDVATNKTNIATNASDIATNTADISALKTDVATNASDIDALETKVDALETGIDDVYTKSEVDAKVSSVYKYKGSVADYASLPTTDLTIGDVYNTEATGDNYAWDGTAWDKLAGTVDLTDYALKTEVTAVETALQAAITAEETARADADTALQKAIDEIELTPGEDGKSGVYLGVDEPAEELEALVWINPEGIASDLGTTTYYGSVEPSTDLGKSGDIYFLID